MNAASYILTEKTKKSRANYRRGKRKEERGKRTEERGKMLDLLFLPGENGLLVQVNKLGVRS